MADIITLSGILKQHPETAIDNTVLQLVQDNIGYYTRIEFNGELYAVASPVDRERLIADFHEYKQREHFAERYAKREADSMFNEDIIRDIEEQQGDEDYGGHW